MLLPSWRSREDHEKCYPDFRYAGFSNAVRELARVGLLDANMSVRIYAASFHL